MIRKKKTISLCLIIAVVVFVLCGCGRTEKQVDSLLQGMWHEPLGNGLMSWSVEFDNGRFTVKVYLGDVVSLEKDGDYEITDEYVILHYDENTSDNGEDPELKYYLSDDGILALDGSQGRFTKVD